MGGCEGFTDSVSSVLGWSVVEEARLSAPSLLGREKAALSPSPMEEALSGRRRRRLPQVVFRTGGRLCMICRLCCTHQIHFQSWQVRPRKNNSAGSCPTGALAPFETGQQKSPSTWPCRMIAAKSTEVPTWGLLYSPLDSRLNGLPNLLLMSPCSCTDTAADVAEGSNQIQQLQRSAQMQSS